MARTAHQDEETSAAAFARQDTTSHWGSGPAFTRPDMATSRGGDTSSPTQKGASAGKSSAPAAARQDAPACKAPAPVRDTPTFVRCLAASTLSMLMVLLFNGPLATAGMGTDALGWERDWATLSAIGGFLALLAASRIRPHLLVAHASPISILAAALTLVSGLLGAFGAIVGSSALATAGACVGNITGSWATLLWLLACARLDLRAACLCFAGASVLAVPFALLITLPGSFQLANAVNTAAALGMLALSLPIARERLTRIAELGAPTDREVSHPQAFLPMRSHLFVYIFAFSLAYGYGLRLATTGGQLQRYVVTCILMLAIVAFVLVARHHPRMDTLFTASFALVLIGYLLVLLVVGPAGSLAPSLLVGGSLCFNLLTWFALCAAARRSAIDALPTLAWGLAVDYAGILVGALIALASGVSEAGGAGTVAARTAVMVILATVVLYVVATRRTFSFDETIEGIATKTPDIVARPVDGLTQRCERMTEQHGLTQREADVLALLARGNNAARIEQELCISHNTVKYHARNVYRKLDVHSQQELIDLLAGRATN